MERGNRKSRVGVVVSNKMKKTVVVRSSAACANREVRQVRDQRREVQGARREAASARSATRSDRRDAPAVEGQALARAPRSSRRPAEV